MTGLAESLPHTAHDTVAEVAVVIVNYGTPALTRRAVDSVRASAGVTARILVIDNASPDDSVAQLRAAFDGMPNVAFHPRAVNDGFTGGANAGLALARADGARWALLLNSDAIVGASCIRALCNEGETDDRIALVNPRILSGMHGDTLWFGGGAYSPWTARPAHVGLNRPSSHGWQVRRDAAYATGCAMLVRVDAVPDDALDTSLFGYAEDLDLSLRLRHDGWRIRYVPDATVWHEAGASHVRVGGNALRFYLTTRNVLRVNARHARWFHWPLLAPMLVVNVVGRYLAATAKRRDAAAFRAVLRGAWHAVSGGRHSVEPSAGR